MNPSDICLDKHQVPVSGLNELFKKEIIDIDFMDSMVFNENSSRIVENLMLKIPVPALYIDRTSDRYICVYGKNVLHALYRFIYKGDVVLSGLNYYPQYNGASFETLSPVYKRRILENILEIVYIEKPTEVTEVLLNQITDMFDK